jgi:hypothetical protein
MSLINGVEKLDIHMQKNDLESFPHPTNKILVQMDESPSKSS